MNTSKMSHLVRLQLSNSAKKALSHDPDFAEGYKITDAEFHRDGAKKECVWLAKIRTARQQVFAVAFNSLEGIRTKQLISA